MALKLYYGGFGDSFVFTVAENEASAISQIGEKINAPFLPITAQEISAGAMRREGPKRRCK